MSGADAPVLESSDDERRPSKPNPKHKSQEFIQDSDSSDDSDFKAKEDTKKLASSDDESGDENKVSSSNIEKNFKKKLQKK